MAPVSCVSVASCFPAFSASQSDAAAPPLPRRPPRARASARTHLRKHSQIDARLQPRRHTCSTPKPHLLLPDAAVSQQPVGFISMAFICAAPLLRWEKGAAAAALLVGFHVPHHWDQSLWRVCVRTRVCSHTEQLCLFIICTRKGKRDLL